MAKLKEKILRKCTLNKKKIKKKSKVNMNLFYNEKIKNDFKYLEICLLHN